MRRLSELAAVLPRVERFGPEDQAVGGIQFWLDHVRPGDLFVAIPGRPIDGHDRIEAAVAAGARAVLCQRLDRPPLPGVSYLRVSDPAEAMGWLAHAFHGFPSERLKVVGITGTNGKTSTAFLLHRLFRRLGRGAGLLSNLGDYVDDVGTEPMFTTGHALHIAEKMAGMVAAGCTHCFMEVSSQSVGESRTAGVRFAGGVFTNLTQDHLDVHGTMEAYAGAKKAWIDALPADAFALSNADDRRGRWMLGDTPARRLTYGTASGCDYRLRVTAETLDGLALEIDGRSVASPLLGGFNGLNLAACHGVACELGEAPDAVAAALATLGPVPGRMQAIRAPDGRTAVVDYAHSPDAVEKVLGLLRRARAPSARILTVIGCGGGGDRTRRAAMGGAAAALSDRLILTDDNPRWEPPERITADLLSGVSAADLPRTEVIPNRRKAIQAACAAAQPGDIVLVAGRGAERFQEAAGVQSPLDDAEEVRAALDLTSA